MMSLVAGAEKLAMEELERANKNFPLFTSDHEGYAVIREELEEACAESNAAVRELEKAWNHIKANNEQGACTAIMCTRKTLLRGIAEMIQAAAMCEKCIQSQEERKHGQNNERHQER